MLCHKQDEVHVKMLCDILIEKCPGLKNSIKVIVSDCEKSISSETCIAFPSAILLLRTEHVEDNVRRNLPNVPSEKKKEEILADTFGTKVVKGLIDALDVDELNAKLTDLYTKWDCEENLSSFKRYFQCYKEDDLRYHVMAGAVKAAEICRNPDKFYNNSHESINKLIKHWQNFKKMDLYEFTKQYENLIEYQESVIQRAFLGLNSPYVVRDHTL